MRLRHLAWVALVAGALGVLVACGAPESTASAASEPAGTAQTGDAAIASLAQPEEQAPSVAVEAPPEPAAEPAAERAPVQVAAAPAERGTPRIVVDEPIFDFGKMEVGQQREHTWVIRNEGDGDLHITNVRPSCGCTNTNMADDIIPPGGRSTLSSVLDLPRQIGPVRKNIAIHSNDPQQRILVVAFAGEATQAIILDPQVVSFPALERDAVVTETADVKAHEEGLVFNITGIRTGSDEAFDVSYETIEEGRHYRVSISTRPPLRSDNLRDRVYIQTDHPTLDMLQLTVVGNVLTDIITAPDVIRLNAEHTDPITRMILLRAGRVTDFKVTGVELPDPSMTYEVTERQAGLVYISVDNIVAAPELDGAEIIVRTDAESVPEVRIPFSVVGAGERTFPALTTGAGDAEASR